MRRSVIKQQRRGARQRMVVRRHRRILNAHISGVIEYARVINDIVTRSSCAVSAAALRVWHRDSDSGATIWHGVKNALSKRVSPAAPANNGISKSGHQAGSGETTANLIMALQTKHGHGDSAEWAMIGSIDRINNRAKQTCATRALSRQRA